MTCDDWFIISTLFNLSKKKIIYKKINLFQSIGDFKIRCMLTIKCLTGVCPITCPTGCCALRTSYPTCSRALLSSVFRLPHASRASSSMWPRVLCFMSPSSLRILLLSTLRILCSNITFFALEFPWITLLFFCSCSLWFFEWN